MILHWNSLEHYYGAQITPHRQHFDSPGQSTFGLLCCRFADEHTRADFAAADMLAQAEHAPGSSILMTWSDEVLDATQAELEKQV